MTTKRTGYPGGRINGVANRIGPHRLLSMMQHVLVEKFGKQWGDYDPVVQLALIGCDTTNPVDIRLVAHSRVAKYIHAELKQIELTGEDGAPIQFQMALADRLVQVIEHKS
tara:strand:+ start:1557 stop:1889 length:333 start_codon:yes stop_codon:yes gene_type:complete